MATGTGEPAVTVVAPAIGNAHVVATHSGVTLAPILGHLVADEVLHRRLDPMLAPYRPGRMLQPAAGT